MVPFVDERIVVGPKTPSIKAGARSGDARLFRSEAHENDPPVSVGSSITKMPAFMESSESAITTKYGSGIRYRGTEYVTNITTPATAPGRGEVLYAIPISPQTIPDTRLQKACEMYTRYRFRRVRFYYSGTAPTTTPGSLMMFCDYDPSQNPSAAPGDGALRYAFTHNAAEQSVWQKGMCEVTDDVYAEMLYCDPDEELRWSVQGCFWLLSSGGLPAATELGKLVMEYEVDFAVPDWRGDISSPSLIDTTLTFATNTAGSTPSCIASLDPTRGAYLVLITGTPSNFVTFYTSKNAYAQGLSPLTLTKGMAFWATKSIGSVNQLRLLWTPDLYSLADPDDAAIVGGNYTGPITVTARIIFVERVMND